MKHFLTYSTILAMIFYIYGVAGSLELDRISLSGAVVRFLIALLIIGVSFAVMHYEPRRIRK